MSETQPQVPAGAEALPAVAAEAGWLAGLGQISARREVIWFSLAAAEMCWFVPLFWGMIWSFVRHQPLLIWAGMLVLTMGFFFFYRALVSANLALRLQQGLLAVGLVLCIVFVLRFHVLAGSELRAVDWLLMPFRDVSDVSRRVPLSWVTIMLMVYLWARAIHLANRSISTEQVGFSFRSGVLLLAGSTLIVRLFTDLDASGFVMAYFFFGLVAVALSRVEEVSHLPNSTSVPFSGFWIGSTVGAVAVLVVLGVLVALFLTTGGLQLLLALLAPVLRLVEVIVVAVGTLLLQLFEWLLDLFSVDLTQLGGQLREVLSQLDLTLEPPQVPPPEGGSQAWLIISRALQIAFTVVLPVGAALLILVLTWRRMRKRSDDQAGGESRESLLSAGVVAEGLQGMLQGGLQRLGELAGLVRQFGPGARFLTAVSIRRIYRNMVRMATEAGYPRDRTETPYEYLATLRRAFPSSESEVRIITEAYVNAHYGQVPDSEEELQRIRDCWERARSGERARSSVDKRRRTGSQQDE